MERYAWYVLCEAVCQLGPGVDQLTLIEDGTEDAESPLPEGIHCRQHLRLTCRADPSEEQEPIVYLGIPSRESRATALWPSSASKHTDPETPSSSPDNAIGHLVQFLATGTRPDPALLQQYPSVHLPILTSSIPVAARDPDLDTLQERLATFYMQPSCGPATRSALRRPVLRAHQSDIVCAPQTPRCCVCLLHVQRLCNFRGEPGRLGRPRALI